MTWNSGPMETPNYGPPWINTLSVIRGEYFNEYSSATWPLGDDFDHDPESISCLCGPDLKITIGLHGEGCTCVLTEIGHNSLDNREKMETQSDEMEEPG